MHEEFDFSDSMPNPHFTKLSKEITLRLDLGSIDYFRKLGEPYGHSAEAMIFRYLRYIAGSGYKMNIGELTLDERGLLRDIEEEEHGIPRKA
jgi:hypothetical protein